MKILHTYKEKRGEEEVDVYVKKLSRHDREEMALVYNKEFYKSLSNGISTEEMIRRSILDNGSGFLSKRDVENLHELYREFTDLSVKMQQAKIDGQNTDELDVKIKEVFSAIYEIESVNKSIFSNSAEALGNRKALTWAALYSSFTKEGENYVYIFDGPTFDSKLAHYYDMCDEPEKYAFELAVFDKSYIMIERFISGDASSESDFKLIEEEINKFFKDGKE